MTRTPPRPRGTRCTIRELQLATDPALRPAYQLLTRTFHRGERVTRREWESSLEEKSLALNTDLTWHLFVAEQGGRVIGLASGTYVGNINLGVVGYLAIAPGLRSHGLGTRLRARLRRAFAQDAARIAQRPLAGVIGEVSESNPWLRRLASRPEVLLLDVPYFQPRLYEDDQPSPFILYYECMDRRRHLLGAQEVRQVLFAVWRRVYRIARPLDRPAFRAMLRALEGRRVVGRRPFTPRA